MPASPNRKMVALASKPAVLPPVALRAPLQLLPFRLSFRDLRIGHSLQDGLRHPTS